MASDHNSPCSGEEKIVGGPPLKVSTTRLSCRECVARMDSTFSHGTSRCGNEKTTSDLPAKVSTTCLSCRDVVVEMNSASSHGASRCGEEKTASGLPAKLNAGVRESPLELTLVGELFVLLGYFRAKTIPLDSGVHELEEKDVLVGVSASVCGGSIRSSCAGG
ncbi:hypothetical protein CDL15_Pgr029179 [Punica granatum]|uniref:Uncharacterized protein n=1 Tax=Punica granatum TaxID=22663 RepID=A0A218XDE0_PUNGR|nr:hypothetical protein CDL15_Pgr029179 [Punica granatum]PKI65438.1 hypothetical protein CRG98_014177 [Punica granatum]